MFEDITRRQGGKRIARRAGFLLGSTVVQGSLLVVLFAVSAYVKARVTEEPAPVDVKFVKPAVKPPPAPVALAPTAPPPPRQPRVAAKRPDLPKPPPPQALVQPKNVEPEMKKPEAPEPEYDWGDHAGEGVVGGVLGGSEAAVAPEVPSWASPQDTKPRMADSGCVQRNIHLTNELLDAAGNSTVLVKFVIEKDGKPISFEALSQNVDPRLAGAIWSAIRNCKWLAGADPHGQPKVFFVTLPLRFATE